MAPYFQCMKLVSSSWLRPRTILDQTTTVTLGAPRVNYSCTFLIIMVDISCITTKLITKEFMLRIYKLDIIIMQKKFGMICLKHTCQY